MPYNCHTSNRLKNCFKKKPWQGNDPTKARFIFVGLDANFDSNIENTLPVIFDYLDDGVCYWKNKRIHHPFCLNSYHGSGKLYHKRFAQIGFKPDEAELVSFVELLHLPTTGRSTLNLSDLSSNQSKEHLCKLANWFDCGSARYIFLVGGKVTELMRQTGMFPCPWLPRNPVSEKNYPDLKVLYKKNGQTIYEIYHFSVHYKKQVIVLRRQIAQIALLPR